MGMGVRCWDDVAIGVWVRCNGVVIAQLGTKRPRLGMLSFHQLINMLAA